MRRALITILFVGGMLEPAQACHRFARWGYPWPQRCGLTAPVHRVSAPPPFEPRTAAEIVVNPDLLEEQARERAIEKLKERLQ
jgi:hypothetical protein